MAHEEFFLLNDREIVVTDHIEVRCDGGNGPLGHPAIYMTLEKGGEAVCKYCGRRYVHTSHEDVPTIRLNGLPTVPSAA
ncbi:MAG TPA: zinc-finger domain-containing protein [Geminicoccaceae bacterium]|nr:zinc-finger domain-containing protein [Geminicoccaceae bacterium]